MSTYIDFLSRLDAMCDIFGISDFMPLHDFVISSHLIESTCVKVVDMRSYRSFKEEIERNVTGASFFNYVHERDSVAVNNLGVSFNHKCNYKLRFLCHLFDSFDIPNSESMVCNILSVVGGICSGSTYLPVPCLFTNQLMHHIFISERQHISAVSISKKYGVSERQVYRCLRGEWV
ncbi:hypothetical protein [Aeromonas sp.]|uniref:hypothetical protein n=1 Tax=Aeromonas sp. TaxID=647 RepID=UPI00258B02F4|nr:hypothetical protein [Aeromonas sp.]MCX7134415.1 hypothetical protein [Aeromonas sp.]